jgi:hypothetical protein
MRIHASRPAGRSFALAALCTSTLSLLACTTMGSGTGTLEPGDTAVKFNWTSKDGGNTGTMSATLADGAAFTGPFLQVTSTSRADSFAPMWYGWRTGWNDWDYWGGGWASDPISVRNYSGKVMANLQGAGSQRMRCKFQLNDPSSGMSGGGQGQCQYASGKTIDAVFARS